MQQQRTPLIFMSQHMQSALMWVGVHFIDIRCICQSEYLKYMHDIFIFNIQREGNERFTWRQYCPTWSMKMAVFNNNKGKSKSQTVKLKGYQVMMIHSAQTLYSDWQNKAGNKYQVIQGSLILLIQWNKFLFFIFILEVKTNNAGWMNELQLWWYLFLTCCLASTANGMYHLKRRVNSCPAKKKKKNVVISSTTTCKSYLIININIS